MSLVKNFLVGGAVVVAADQLGPMVPFAPGGFPVGKWLAAVVGAYVGEKVAGSGVSFKRAAILGVTALAAAELKDTVAASIQFPLPIVGDAARILAGGVGLWGASALGVEPAA